MSYKPNGGTTETERAKPDCPAHGSGVTGAITAIGQWSVNHAVTTIMLFLAVAGLSAIVTAATLRIDTNPALMINKDLPFRKNYFDLSKQFPALDNRLPDRC